MLSANKTADCAKGDGTHLKKNWRKNFILHLKSNSYHQAGHANSSPSDDGGVFFDKFLGYVQTTRGVDVSRQQKALPKRLKENKFYTLEWRKF